MDDPSIFTRREQPLTLGAVRQLLLDDYCVEETNGLERRLHQPETCGPVMVPRSELGEVSLQSRSVPQWNPDKGLWEWWYWGYWECEPHGPHASTQTVLTQYAVSTDGMAWETPALGRHEWRGTRDNNVSMAPDSGSRALYHIIRDDRDPDPSRRYKGLLGNKDRQPAVSPDGITWSALDVPPIPSSDESHFCYDEIGARFVAMVKHGTVWGRSVFLATSDDFDRWEHHGIVLHADAVDWENRRRRIRAVAEDARYLSPPLIDEEDYMAETYQMAVMPYQGLYVGFPLIFNPAGAVPPPHGNYTGLNQTELAVSRDLCRWRRLCDREIFLGVEPWDGENFATQQIAPCGRPIVRDDQIWIYHIACRFRGPKDVFPEQYHPYFRAVSALSLAKLRLDGFVSLDASGEGTLLTKRLRLEGRELMVNVEAPQGELRAQILDADSLQPLPGLATADCVPVTQDGLRVPVRWTGDRSAGSARDRMVRIQFSLRNASLYAFWMS
jgi:hypothetical protein